MTLEVLAGDIILADDHNKLLPITAEKSGDTSRTSTTTHTADPHLAISLGVGTFDLRGLLYAISAADAAGDFSYRWAWTGTMAVRMGGVGPTLTLASGTVGDGEFARQLSDSSSPSAAIAYGVSAAGVGIPILGRVVVTVAGTLTVEWAQQNSNANATTLQSGSFITATPVA